ncbi:hypothetical protein TUBRATIS_006060 [Tubulinosema ratisbonensis]|uniref:Uncharacterized protein n=1 Tax=Tubulinosema ratisbonensis TaxID=291195 RepID=A0A437APB8_9MICR|nr:hypothetical protein TUBRATIS_006060 [Tubulinosema ratisbonensis]
MEKIEFPYLVFCILVFAENFIYVMYTRFIITDSFAMGKTMSTLTFYGAYSFLLQSLLSFISLSFGYLSYKFPFVIIYFMFKINLLINTVLVLPWATRVTLYFIPLVLQIFELFFVYYHFNLFFGRSIIHRNKKMGNSVVLKKAYNVSVKLIRLDYIRSP